MIFNFPGNANAIQILTSQGCFHREYFAGVEHKTTRQLTHIIHWEIVTSKYVSHSHNLQEVWTGLYPPNSFYNPLATEKDSEGLVNTTTATTSTTTAYNQIISARFTCIFVCVTNIWNLCIGSKCMACLGEKNSPSHGESIFARTKKYGDIFSFYHRLRDSFG